MNKRKERTGKLDFKIFLTVLILLIIGNIMVFSSSWPYAVRKGLNPYNFIIKHIIFSVVGIIAMLIISFLDYRLFRKYAYVLYILSIILSIVVLFTGDLEKYAAKRWLDLGPITVMPSDFLKVGTILAVCKYIDKNKNKLNTVAYGLIPMLVFMLISCSLVYLQPDLSTTMVMGIIILLTFVIGGVNLIQSAISLFILGGVGIIGIKFSRSTYSRFSRIEAWIDPLKDFANTGWQLAQSLFAISYGGFFGVGLGKSRHKFSYLSEAHNDFIFAIIAEELGFLGSITIILIYLYLIYLGMKLAFRIRDSFAKLTVISIMLLVGIQAFLNISVALGIVPPTGLTLPLISYGGSSLLVFLGMMGIVLNISRQEDRR